MRMVNFILALLLACIASAAEAQEIRKSHEDFPQQHSVEEQPSMENNRFFIDLGVERRYNTINRQMETVPIITPGIKVSKKLVIGLPFGDFAKYLFTESAPKKQRPMAPTKK